MLYNTFRETYNPFATQGAYQNTLIFKESKPIEVITSKKRLGAMAWDLSGQRIVTGASDGNIKVREHTEKWHHTYKLYRFTSSINLRIASHLWPPQASLNLVSSVYKTFQATHQLLLTWFGFQGGRMSLYRRQRIGTLKYGMQASRPCHSLSCQRRPKRKTST